MTYKLLDDFHGKIAVQGFILLGKLIEKIGKGFSAETLESIIPKLIEKWGEPKQVIRHSTSAVMTKVITRILPPHQLSSCLIAQLNIQNSHVKEEMINFVCYCLLKHPSCPYDYEEIVHGLCSSLKDTSIRVKIVSAETIAVVYRNIGDDLTPLLEPVRHSHAKTYAVLQKRLKQPLLPMLCKTKGVIQHKLLNKFNAQQYKRKRVQSAFRSNIPSTGLDADDMESDIVKRRNYRRRHKRAHSAPRRMQNEEDELTTYTIPNDMSSDPHLKKDDRGRIMNNRYSNIEPEETETTHLPNINESHSSSSSSSRSSKVSIWLQNGSESSSSIEHSPSKNNHSGTSKRMFYPNVMDTHEEMNTSSEGPTLFKDELSISNENQQKPSIHLPVSPSFSNYEPSPANSVASAPGSTQKRPKRLRTHKKRTEPSTPNNLESGQSPKVGGSLHNQLAHVSSTDIEPSPDPQRELKEALKLLASSLWDEQHQGVTSIRRLCVHHPEILRGHVSPITSFILKHINGLRSLLCKNAIVCIEDMYRALKRQMDGSINKSVPLLLKKSSDTNRFISKQAELSLIACVSNCSKDKTTTAVMGHVTDKNSTIRHTCAIVLYHVIIESRSKLVRLKTFEQILTVLVKFLSDSSASCRSQGRKMANALVENLQSHQPDVNVKSFLKHKLHSQTDVRKLLEAAATAATPATPSTPSNLASLIHSDTSKSSRLSKTPKSRQSTPKQKKAKSPLVSPKKSKNGSRHRSHHHAPKLDSVTLETLQLEYDKVSTNDWRKRSQALEAITSIVVEQHDHFSDHDVAVLFDHVLPRLSDSHIKVHAVAYGTLQEILPLTSDKLGQVRLRLFQSIVSGLNASSARMAKHARLAFQDCIAHSSKESVAQIYPHMLKATQNPKVHQEVLEHMCVWLDQSKPKKRSMLRYFVPSTNRLYSSAKSHPPLKTACVEFLKIVYEEVGNDLFSHVSNVLSSDDMDWIREHAST
eukprot:CAMPEP_0117420210 /NCGR_PEP_ID=MMETSP0758-20121206/1589_1 /TAXON_ID=63605 /ORGANISM="Percolomonas cosmopolitus, Strain AE-1 (ATCC 50343)" /LENGTH=978 /DNA_ID=CAMNT_0005201681 /DNA_START=292 /DNA_END=3228 /DNA_ORIENTATION=-